MELIEDTRELESELFVRLHRKLLADDTLRADFRSLVRDHGRFKVRKWLLAAWDKRIEIELADAAGTLQDSVPAANDTEVPARALLGQPWRNRLRQLALVLDTRGPTAKEAAAGLFAASMQTEARPAFEAAWAALFTKEGSPRKQLGTIEALPLVQSELDQLAERIREHDAWCDHLRMVRLSRALLVEYAALKRERGLADMADLERCALALLRDSLLAAWVQERLDAQVRHLLIDEFQDTSPLQWQALHAWLCAYAGAGGGASGQRPPALFVVGDPKQSIYRFRRAEPRVFAAAREFVVEGLGGAVLECDHTRRNRPEVLSAVNAVFGTDAVYAGFRAHTSEVDAAGEPSVFVLPQVERPREGRSSDAMPMPLEWRDSLTTPRREPEEVLRQQEADLVAQAVHRLVTREGVAPGEIMVLCRQREPLRLLAQSLQALHLPFAAADDAPLAESPEARDLIALLDALASPRHDLSLAHALRSPCFGASDRDLQWLALRSREGSGSWREALDGAPEGLLSAVLRRARDLLAVWQEASLQLPPHDLLDRIVAEGEVHARVAAAVPPERRASALAAIDALLAHSLAQGQGRFATPYGFVRALRRRALVIAAPGQLDAVQLLTVHGAKGLESRIVFVMDADPERRNNETATVLVDWHVDEAAPRRCAFIAAESRVPAALSGLMSYEFRAREREEKNGLYVAMTRARERLVFSATQPYIRPSAISWWQRVTGHAELWVPGPATAMAASAVPIRLPALPEWEPAPPPVARQPSPDDGPATRLGRAVHRVLEWCAAKADPDHVLRCSTRAAEEFSVESAHEVARVAQAVLGSSAAARFLHDPTLRWAGNEVGIAVGGAVHRIDRLVQLANGQWWVLDYKLSGTPLHEPAHLEQLRAYRNAVAELEPGASVCCAFVTGAGELIEIDAQ